MSSPPAKPAEDLLEAVARGDRVAFKQLYAQTSKSLFPICLKILRNREVAEDVLQDAYFRIWQKAHLYDRAKGSALAWLSTLTRRCVFDRARSSPPPAASVDELAEVLPDSQAFDRAGDAMTEAGLRSCIEALDAKYREPILLAYFQGLTHEELAERLDAPLGTVKSWVARGLAQLKDCMGE